MSFKIVEVFSENLSPDWLLKIKDFCRISYQENKHEAHINMQYEDWEKAPASLLYLLCIEKRFSIHNGGLQLLVNEGGSIVAVSGYYRSDFNDRIYIIGVRSWVLKEFRHNLLIAEYMLPYQLNEVVKRNADFALITFNESTRAFAQLIERANKNPNDSLKFFFGSKYPDLYKDMKLWPYPLKIKNVKQWVLIKSLTKSHFDWASLTWTES